jgi:serine/threonine protein kinase
MGEVYRATDTNLKRQVAIKVLPASVAGNVDRLARFQREAEVLTAFNHPNIAAIYGLERAPDVTALVMELVEGEERDGRELFYVASNGAMMSASLLFSKDRHSLEISDVKQLFRVPIVFGGSPRDNNKEQYAVAPDGRRFLVNVRSDETTGSPVTVVLNWLSGLRR